MRITNHQHLYATKRQIIFSVPAHDCINGVHQVSPYHRYFINYEQIQGSDDFDLLFAQLPVCLRHLILGNQFLHIRKVWAERKLEEGVDCYAAGIDCRHACRRKHDTAFRRILYYVL